MTTKQIHNAITQGTRDAQARLDSAAQTHNALVNDSRSDRKPNFAIIYQGEQIVYYEQLTRDIIHMFAQWVYEARQKSEHEPKGFMPENWIGVYIIGEFLKQLYQRA